MNEMKTIYGKATPQNNYYHHVAQLVGKLADAIVTDSNGKRFLRQLVEIRYQKLLEHQEIPSKDYCSPSFRKSLERKFILKGNLSGEFSQLIDQVVEAFQSLPENTVPVWLGNLVEYFLVAAINEPQHVGAFLSSCFFQEVDL
jgi:hypothetical protein